MSIETIKPGAMRYTRDGVHEIVNPNDPLYSTALFLADEFFDGQAWQPMSEMKLVSRPRSHGKSFLQCDHDWPENSQGTDLDGSCTRCGMSFQYYIHTQCP